jgi:hypothetical protein
MTDKENKIVVLREFSNIYDANIALGAGVCHFRLKIFSNELLHSSFLFCIFVRIST